MSNTPETPLPTRWVRWALAGLAVGVNVMQGADIGAIFSIFIAAFVMFKTLADESGSIAVKLGRGAGRVAVIAVFAGFMAVQTVVSLFGTSITGIAGTGQDAEGKARQWNFCTQWSLPKVETLGLFVPGLFGYKMDTPNYMDFFQDAYRGGNYWGAIGRDPVLDPYFANGAKGTPPAYSFMRQTGGGGYAGILVALLAAWAVAQSFRRQNSVFGDNHRRMIWFWFALLVISLPLAFGRFGFFGGYPFQLLYELPGASLIRNPTKFMLVFSWAIVVLFAYGVHGLSRRYLEVPAGNSKLRGFDRKWAWACLIAFAASVLAWLIFASQKAGLASYLQVVGFPEKDLADGNCRVQHRAGRMVPVVLCGGDFALPARHRRSLCRETREARRHFAWRAASRGSGTREFAVDCPLELPAKIRHQPHHRHSSRQALRTPGH